MSAISNMQSMRWGLFVILCPFLFPVFNIRGHNQQRCTPMYIYTFSIRKEWLYTKIKQELKEIAGE